MLDISLDCVEDKDQYFLNRFKDSRKFPQWGRMGNFAGGIFLSGGGNLRRSDFDHLNLFKVKNNIP